MESMSSMAFICLFSKNPNLLRLLFSLLHSLLFQSTPSELGMNISNIICLVFINDFFLTSDRMGIDHVW